MPLLIECGWTVEVQDEFRVGNAENYTSFVLMLKATKLHAESQSAWDDEEDGRPFVVIGGRRLQVLGRPTDNDPTEPAQGTSAGL